MKVLTVVGARPQFIKAASVSRAIASSFDIREVLVHTGQHHDHNLSKVFFEEMQIPAPHYHLGIGSLGHGAMTGRMMEALEEVMLAERPDWVLVYGDTNSTLAGALTARKLHIKICHIEAGLRSFNMSMPEEINRVLTDRISDLLLCPTDSALRNLKEEGYDNFACRRELVGDVMYDASIFYAKSAQNRSKIMTDLELEKDSFVLATLHRQENTDSSVRLNEIVAAINQLSKETKIVIPLHPRTKKRLEESNLKLNCTVTSPLGYFDMLQLLQNCSHVLTDSGGLQKEAYFFRKLCLTMRDETEWVELVEAGVNKLVGWKRTNIVNQWIACHDSKNTFDSEFYGDGRASEKIVEILRSWDHE
jgi:UDP-GlcNAc3NAcA epimerase